MKVIWKNTVNRQTAQYFDFCYPRSPNVNNWVKKKLVESLDYICNPWYLNPTYLVYFVSISLALNYEFGVNMNMICYSIINFLQKWRLLTWLLKVCYDQCYGWALLLKYINRSIYYLRMIGSSCHGLDVDKFYFYGTFWGLSLHLWPTPCSHLLLHVLVAQE